MPKRRGRNAARQGLYGEQTAEAILSTKFEMVDHKQWHGQSPCAIRQYPCPHPFRPEKKRGGKNDYLLSTGTSTIYVQVKNQTQGGTTDEKLAFTFDIARYGLMDVRFSEFWLVLLGPHWEAHPGIIEYCNRKCEEFQMLASGMRTKVKAQTIVGPIALSKLVQGLSVVWANGDHMF